MSLIDRIYETHIHMTTTLLISCLQVKNMAACPSLRIMGGKLDVCGRPVPHGVCVCVCACVCAGLFLQVCVYV